MTGRLSLEGIEYVGMKRLPCSCEDIAKDPLRHN
jgi:hypothetical protein